MTKFKVLHFVVISTLVMNERAFSFIDLFLDMVQDMREARKSVPLREPCANICDQPGQDENAGPVYSVTLSPVFLKPQTVPQETLPKPDGVCAPTPGKEHFSSLGAS